MLLREVVAVDLLVVSVAALVALLDVGGRALLLVDRLVDGVVERLTLEIKIDIWILVGNLATWSFFKMTKS